MFIADAKRLLEYEAQSLLHRLAEIRPFALTLPMVPAAAPSVAAQAAIEAYLSKGRRELRTGVHRFLRWLRSPRGSAASPSEAQARYTALRLQFLTMIDQFDVFSRALVERSQHGYGEWSGGLDVVATDALTLPGYLTNPPPIICHLDRGAGAAIRRVRTRLPGGGVTPVALIRVPRERMIGSSISSSLVHEVGHQGAELLVVLPVLRQRLLARAARAGADRAVWLCFHAWISEIFSDLWSVARVGVTSTMGLMGVVSLPKVFVFRVEPDDPHPTPWVRVKISAALGQALYPDPQWEQLAGIWDQYYPLAEAPPRSRGLMASVQSAIREFVHLALDASLPAAGGAKVGALFPRADRTPARLRALRPHVRKDLSVLSTLTPTVAFAVVGQAKCDGAINAWTEASTLSRLLRFWALRATVDAAMAYRDTFTPASRAVA